MERKTIGESTLNEVLPQLQEISKVYGLRLYNTKDFKLARLILANLYSNHLI